MGFAFGNFEEEQLQKEDKEAQQKALENWIYSRFLEISDS